MRRGRLARVALERVVLLAVLWWALTAGDPTSFGWGAVAILLATALSLHLDPSATHVRWSRLPRFAAGFLTGSFKGAVDVAYRALAPRMPIAPAVVFHRLSAPPGPARNLFLVSVSLMPGTLVIEVDGDHARIHVLRDQGDATLAELRSLERLAAGVFPELPHG